MKNDVEYVLVRKNALSIFDKATAGRRIDNKQRKRNHQFRKELRKVQGHKLKVYDKLGNDYRVRIADSYLVINEGLIQSLYFSEEFMLNIFEVAMQTLLKKDIVGFSSFYLEYENLDPRILTGFARLHYLRHFDGETDTEREKMLIEKDVPLWITFFGSKIWDILGHYSGIEPVTLIISKKNKGEYEK